MSAAERDLAHLLSGLRREGRQQSGLDPALVPVDRDAAYRVAGLVAAELGLDVAGWKIAAAKAEMQRQLRTDAPIYGRVYAPNVRLGADLPPRAAPYTRDEVDVAVASLHPGIELAECRFVHDDRFPPLAAVLADGAGGGTICYGPPIEDWRRRDIAGQEVVLSCNGAARRRGTAAEALDHPLVPLTWLANELSRTGVGLAAGQVVSTGTLTGMLRPRAGETFVADFGPFGTVTATYA